MQHPASCACCQKAAPDFSCETGSGCYCQTCWRDLPTRVVTVHAYHDQTVSCVGMDGASILPSSTHDFEVSTIGDLRRQVLEQVGGSTAHHLIFSKLANGICVQRKPDGSGHTKVCLALPDGRILCNAEDTSKLQKLLQPLSFYVGDMVAYEGEEQKLAGKMLRSGAQGEVISTEGGKLRVRFQGLSSVICSATSLVYCGAQSESSQDALLSKHKDALLVSLLRPCQQANHSCLKGLSLEARRWHPEPQ
eukprot:TRINITY_DN23819_c0_g1_i1.p1 TRINITY_DN23819_c0_g1~~TRINITY_DN23819_c0_g1_i1.p1  ORF type:complete len:249 (-),score=37.39 TRINITY_DN23819_c0_g1_i1:63-809(-)